MSMTKLVFPSLCWSELAHIMSYLSLYELYMLGNCNRTAFITYTRERPLRKLKASLLNNARFLSKGSGHDKVLLVSYPRSGNSFLRKLLEVETSIITGSDSRPNRTLSASLLQCGYKGEGIVDDSVWVVKSHFPERLGYVKFNASRVILLVRNPFDAIESYFHMGMTNTHDKMLTPEIFQTLKEQWTACVANEATVWTHFHEYWKRQSTVIPILMIRYEDLLKDEQGVMVEVIKFMSEAVVPVGLSRFMSKKSELSQSISIREDCTSNSSIESVDQSIKVSIDPSGPGYKPKKKKVGKALRPGVMEAGDVLAVMRVASLQMKEFGYDIEVSKTPSDGSFNLIVSPLTNSKGEEVLSRVLPPLTPPTTSNGGKAVSLSKNDDILKTIVESASSTVGWIRVNEAFSVRHKDDSFGRLFTVLRRGITSDDTKPFPTL